jgi:L-threonylcarbamoyladenylate synthase
LKVVRIVPATTEWIDHAADVLRRGGVVGYPTDTLYGLAVDPRQDRAVRRLFELKGREAVAAIPLIAASLDQATGVGEVSSVDRRLAERFWPGPLTIVMPAKAGLAPSLLGRGSTIGVRVPAQQVAVSLASTLGFAITSTSANRSGQPPATTAGQVASALDDAIDLVLDDGPSPGGAPSTIVEVMQGRARLIRAGAVPWERVLESLE